MIFSGAAAPNRICMHMYIYISSSANKYQYDDHVHQNNRIYNLFYSKRYDRISGKSTQVTTPHAYMIVTAESGESTILFKRMAMGLYTLRALELFRMYANPAPKVQLRTIGSAKVPAAWTDMNIFCDEVADRVTLYAESARCNGFTLVGAHIEFPKNTNTNGFCPVCPFSKTRTVSPGDQPVTLDRICLTLVPCEKWANMKTVGVAPALITILATTSVLICANTRIMTKHLKASARIQLQ